MDHLSTPCDGCPFSSACPLKSRVQSPCIVGRNPTKVYLGVWSLAVLASVFVR